MFQEPRGAMGGAELQTWLQARFLAEAGFDVIFVTGPIPPERLTAPPGVRVITMDPNRALQDAQRFPHGLRSLAYYWYIASRGVGHLLTLADADVYVQRAAGVETLRLAIFARTHRRRFIYEWASDQNMLGPTTRQGLANWLFRLGRRLAHVQLLQTQYQLALLPPRERRRAKLFPNLLDTTVSWGTSESSGDNVLWVGAIRPEWKRPDLFLELAHRLPHRQFRMVGRIVGDDAFRETFLRRAGGLANVQLAGPKNRDELPAEYAAARVLVNTSDTEGFPNTFLEAMACGVPVVSLNIDPDGLVENGGGTLAKGSMDDLAEGVEGYFSDLARLELCRKRAIAGAARHDPVQAVKSLAGLVSQLASEKP